MLILILGLLRESTRNIPERVWDTVRGFHGEKKDPHPPPSGNSPHSPSLNSLQSETKNQPKEEILGRISLRTSGKNFDQAIQILEIEAFWNGHPTRMSLKKLRSDKFWADFSFPLQTCLREGHMSTWLVSLFGSP